LRRIIPN